MEEGRNSSAITFFIYGSQRNARTVAGDPVLLRRERRPGRSAPVDFHRQLRGVCAAGRLPGRSTISEGKSFDSHFLGFHFQV